MVLDKGGSGVGEGRKEGGRRGGEGSSSSEMRSMTSLLFICCLGMGMERKTLGVYRVNSEERERRKKMGSQVTEV